MAFDLKPSLCAVRAVSSHSSPSILWSQMMERTRGGEDFRAAAGHGIDARFAQLEESFFNGELGAAGEKGDLDHGEGLDVDLGKALLEAADQVEEELEGQIGVQAADDVELGDGFGVAGGRGLPSFFEGHGVAGGIALFAAEGAELAGRHADVGGVDVAIDVEVGHVAVHPLAHVVGQPAHGQHVGRAIEREAVFRAEPLLRHHFGGNRLKPRVIGLKCVAGSSGAHPLR